MGVMTMIAGARTRIDSPESVAVKFSSDCWNCGREDHAAEEAER